MNIYAELNSRMLKKIEENDTSLDLPEDVKLIRKKGSRCCYFECDTKESYKELQNWLDNRNICYQLD